MTPHLSDAVQRLLNQYNESKIAAVVITLMLFAIGWLVVSYGSGSKFRGAVVTQGINGSISKHKPTQPIESNASDDGKLRNVFSVKQKPPIPGQASKNDSSDRPFFSSYYYAHNNSNSKGGYADGLRAEDYVMNGPRLLSKGGVRVDEAPGASKETSQETDDTADVMRSDLKAAVERPKLATASKQITRYLWDDDGGDIAKIHIDSLPKKSAETLPWQEASISKEDVTVSLIGEDNDGLIVRINSETQKYHLHVTKMYGSADAVKAVVKKHKLLIKITKRNIKKRQGNEGLIGSISGALFGQADSLRSVKWPQLSSTGGEIDERAFKEVDFKDMDSAFD